MKLKVLCEANYLSRVRGAGISANKFLDYTTSFPSRVRGFPLPPRHFKGEECHEEDVVDYGRFGSGDKPFFIIRSSKYTHHSLFVITCLLNTITAQIFPDGIGQLSFSNSFIIHQV